MYCSRCGQENPDDAQFCSSCSCILQTAVPTASVDVRTSGLAIASCLFGILSLLALPGVVPPQAVPPSLGLAAAISAILLGIISLIQINAGAGTVAGKGFAVVGIVIPAIVLPLLFLTSSLARTRSIAFRMPCGTNLSYLGRAMLIYANDYEDQLPRAGGRGSQWSNAIPNWQALDRYRAYGVNPADGSGGNVTISSSLYLLVKYSEVATKSFVCKHDSGTSPFKFSKYRNAAITEEFDAWDFGPEPWKHYSYSYHIPYTLYPLTASSDPGMAVAADRTPWIDSPAAKAKDFSRFKPDLPQFGGTVDQARYGNSVSHKEDGQNILFMDCHVEFAKRSYCAVDDDNLYTHLPDGLGDPQIGKPPVPFTSQPGHRKDSLLLHDPPAEAGK